MSSAVQIMACLGLSNIMLTVVKFVTRDRSFRQPLSFNGQIDDLSELEAITEVLKLVLRPYGDL